MGKDKGDKPGMSRDEVDEGRDTTHADNAAEREAKKDYDQEKAKTGENPLDNIRGEKDKNED